MDEIEVWAACPECDDGVATDTECKCSTCDGKGGWTVHKQVDEVDLPEDVAVSLYRSGRITASQLETFKLSDLYALIVTEAVAAA